MFSFEALNIMDDAIIVDKMLKRNFPSDLVPNDMKYKRKT